MKRHTLPLLLACLSCAACGSSSSAPGASDITQNPPANSFEDARTKDKFLGLDDYFSSWTFTSSLYDDLVDPALPNYIGTTSGMWVGDLSLMVDGCSPGSFGGTVQRRLYLQVFEDDTVLIVDELGRTYRGITDAFITLHVDLTSESDQAGLSSGYIDFVSSSNSASVTLHEELERDGKVCTNEYWGGMERDFNFTGSQETPPENHE